MEKRNPVSRRTLLAGGAVAAGMAGLRHGWASSRQTSEQPMVDCGFPGGNIVLERIEGDEVYLHQDQRDTPDFWFYWYFRVRGAAGRELAFHFTRGDVLTSAGPAVSADGGANWSWLGRQSSEPTFRYAFGETNDSVRFCLAVPYVEADLMRFLSRYRDHPHLRVDHHATTRKGRRTERLHAGRLNGTPRHRVLLTVRHHACETMASWSLEGILEAVLADDEIGRWFRENVEIAALPFMDKDGVEEGDQGKNRRPHDHNRDYLETSIYPAVAELRRFAPAWSEGRLATALDMHCPWIRGGGEGRGSNEQVFFVGHPDPEVWEEQQAFSRTLEAVQAGPLRHESRFNIPWGESWNTGEEPRSCSRWAAGLPGIRVAATIEIPYALVGEKEVTVAGARLLGHDLARAMRVYLES